MTFTLAFNDKQAVYTSISINKGELVLVTMDGQTESLGASDPLVLDGADELNSLLAAIWRSTRPTSFQSIKRAYVALRKAACMHEIITLGHRDPRLLSNPKLIPVIHSYNPLTADAGSLKAPILKTSVGWNFNTIDTVVSIGCCHHDHGVGIERNTDQRIMVAKPMGQQELFAMMQARRNDEPIPMIVLLADGTLNYGAWLYNSSQNTLAGSCELTQDQVKAASIIPRQTAIELASSDTPLDLELLASQMMLRQYDALINQLECATSLKQS